MELDQIIGAGLQLKKLFNKKMEPLIQEYDLRPVELDILVFLSREEGANTAREIMRRKHLSKAHISKSIDNMRVRGLIEIHEDTQDHRLLHLVLTEKAREVIKKADVVYEVCSEILQRNLSEKEIQSMKDIFWKMNQNIMDELDRI